ncbi:huntingtin-interacting protein 1-related protein [Drosophila ficusphila]|uniref:huntingtin-interacting protein 1-related protein n=1 Tax=Drosophila ficusphila TaxID=30025 RepID=UPI0007E61524|nr:huntingtin-interacting protein 1-related protein [Drosophila ficusphila]
MATHAEKDFYHLNVSVSKALNGLEAPLKTKHARSIIIMIHKAKEAKTFWMIISRQPLMQSRFTAWKFSHLLHKVLREAHESSIRHSQSHKKMILEVGKMWGLLQDDIGCCIQAYSKLLATKLNFHDKNRMFPGSLNISFTELFIAVDRDLNYCFQLCVEIFDYLEDIIALQLTIFSSMEKYRMSSMTPQGQCRLAPIVCLIQDSNALYDLSVRLMFKLHDGVPYDVVSGHRDRFHGLFLKLKSFYNNVRPLQYFKDLITVPELPDSSPNFKSQNDFTSYVPPVVHVPQEPDPVVEDLVDTNNHESEAFSQAQQQLSMLEGIISEKEAGIEELSFKLVSLQKNFDELQQSYRNDIQELQQNNTVLSNDLVLAREMCATFRMQNDDLELQLNQNPILLQKAMEEEEKHKLSSEKFNKLKTLYTKIRDEHIQLLREQSDCNKSLNREKQVNSQLLLETKELSNEIAKIKGNVEEKEKVNLTLQKQIEEHKEKVIQLEAIKNEIKEKLDDVVKQKEIQELDINSTSENLRLNCLKVEELNVTLNETKEKLLNAESQITVKSQEIENITKAFEAEKALLLTKLEQQNVESKNNSDAQSAELLQTKSNLEQKDKDLNEVKNKLSTAESEISLKVVEIENNSKAFEAEKALLLTKIDELVLEHKQNSDALNAQLQQTTNKLEQKESALEHTQIIVQQLREEINLAGQSNEDLQSKLTNTEDKLTQATQQINSVTSSLETCNSDLSDLRKLVIKTVKEICNSKLSGSEQQPLDAIPNIISEMEILLNKFNSSSALNFVVSTEGMKDVMFLGYIFIKLYDQCDVIYKTTTAIETGQEIFAKTSLICTDVCQLFQYLLNNETKDAERQKTINDIQAKLKDIGKLIEKIKATFEQKIDLDKLLEIELREMDAAIDDAASKITDLLAKAREKDNQTNLEVNGKIVDACTTLMECVKALIQKSRLLQHEIVASQKGNASANEFYRRNSQWSDGLISASKSVAKAANYLVEAANKAIESESGKNFELIVAAQEIAACTTQMVIASKVKAERNSQKLSDLTKASRSVTQATGTLVATVKDCNSQLEQQSELELAKLTPSQIKTMEMEIHVKVLETEQVLQMQRLKLSAFRKEHYKNADY